jgi:hypothetical protein
MAAIYSERFVVSTADDLDELELTLGEGELEAVVVEVPESATALLGAREFRRVLAAARDAGTSLVFSTDDPLRRELARIVGARLTEPEPEPTQPATTRVDPNDALTHRIAPAVARRTMSEDDDDVGDDDQATFHLWQPGRQAGHWDAPEQTDASYSFVITPPTRGNVVVEPDEMTTQTREHPQWHADIPRFEDWERITAVRHAATRPAAFRRSRVIAALILALTLLVIASILALFVIPTATITVTPQVSPVNVDLTYGIAQPGATWDVTIEPTTIENTLTFSATAATTGERFEPDAAATGVLQLTNPATEEIVIPAGSSFFSDGGVEVVSLTEIVVPAADPYSSLMFGSAAVDVRSAIAGPDGDIGAQAVFGQLDSGVFFVNRAPVSGGTLKRIATVTQADLDALNQQARAELTGKAPTALDGRVPQGQQIVTDSQQQGTVVISYDQAAGADAPSVKIDASLRVSAQTFDPAAALQQASDEASRRIAAAAGEQARLLPASLSIADPQPVEGANGNAFTIHASGSAEALIDAAALEAIRSDLAGSSQSDATARIQQVAGVAGVTIARERSWISDGLPRFASRISVVIQDSTARESSSASAEGVSP